MPTIKELYKRHGYFSLIFKKMTQWEWYKDIPCKVVMLHLIHECMKVDTSYRGEIVKRGQYRTSRNRLAEETGLTPKQVWRALEKLEKTCDIKRDKSRAKRRTIITLVNFDTYQPEILFNEQDMGQGKGQVRDKSGTRYKELVKDIKEKTIKEKSTKKENGRCTGEQVYRWFVENGLDRNRARLEAEKFINYYESNGWRVGRNPMKSWQHAAAGWKSRVGNFEHNNRNEPRGQLPGNVI